jgi:hypothetical protein
VQHWLLKMRDLNSFDASRNMQIKKRSTQVREWGMDMRQEPLELESRAIVKQKGALRPKYTAEAKY